MMLDWVGSVFRVRDMRSELASLHWLHLYFGLRFCLAGACLPARLRNFCVVSFGPRSQIGFGISVAPTGPTLAQTSRQTLWSRTSTFWRSQRIGCYETVSGKASKHSCRLHDPSLEAALARFKSVILNMPYMRQEPIGLLRGLVSATSSVNRSTREA